MNDQQEKVPVESISQAQKVRAQGDKLLGDLQSLLKHRREKNALTQREALKTTSSQNHFATTLDFRPLPQMKRPTSNRPSLASMASTVSAEVSHVSASAAPQTNGELSPLPTLQLGSLLSGDYTDPTSSKDQTPSQSSRMPTLQLSALLIGDYHDSNSVARQTQSKSSPSASFRLASLLTDKSHSQNPAQTVQRHLSDSPTLLDPMETASARRTPSYSHRSQGEISETRPVHAGFASLVESTKMTGGKVGGAFRGLSLETSNTERARDVHKVARGPPSSRSRSSFIDPEELYPDPGNRDHLDGIIDAFSRGNDSREFRNNGGSGLGDGGNLHGGVFLSNFGGRIEYPSEPWKSPWSDFPNAEQPWSPVSQQSVGGSYLLARAPHSSAEIANQSTHTDGSVVITEIVDGVSEMSNGEAMEAIGGSHRRTASIAPSVALSDGDDGSQLSDRSLPSKAPRLRWGAELLVRSVGDPVVGESADEAETKFASSSVEAAEESELRQRLAQFEAAEERLIHDNLALRAAVEGHFENAVAASESDGPLHTAVERRQAFEHEQSVLRARTEAANAESLRVIEEMRAVAEVLESLFSPRSVTHVYASTEKLATEEHLTEEAKGKAASVARDARGIAKAGATDVCCGAEGESLWEVAAQPPKTLCALLALLRERIAALGDIGPSNDFKTYAESDAAVVAAELETAQMKFTRQKDDLWRQRVAAGRVQARAVHEEAKAARLEIEVSHLREWVAEPHRSKGYEKAAAPLGGGVAYFGGVVGGKGSCVPATGVASAPPTETQVSCLSALPKPCFMSEELQIRASDSGSSISGGIERAGCNVGDNICVNASFRSRVVTGTAVARSTPHDSGDSSGGCAAEPAGSLQADMQLLEEDCAALQDLRQRWKSVVAEAAKWPFMAAASPT